MAKGICAPGVNTEVTKPMPRGRLGPLSGQLWLLKHEVQSPRCSGSGAVCLLDGVNGTFAHCSLPWCLFNVLAIVSKQIALEGQMPPSVAREYPRGCSGFCCVLDKKGRKPKYPVPEPCPCPWPHSCTTWSAKATGSQRVAIVHC